MTLSKFPNSSFYDISYKLGWNVNKVSNRFNELQNAGLIVKTGTETRGKFERELFSIVTDKDSIINKQNELYRYFTDCKSQLEEDYLRCETKEGKGLIRKRIDYMKTKISNLKLQT